MHAATPTGHEAPPTAASLASRLPADTATRSESSGPAVAQFPAQPAPQPALQADPLPTASGPARSPPVSLHRQVADAVVRSTGGVVEITLAPVELGRLTVVIGADDNPARLSLLAERPETLELMRRHGDMLLRDLRESGMPDAQLSFQRSDGPGRQAQAAPVGWPADGAAGAGTAGAGTSGGHDGASGGQRGGDGRHAGTGRQGDGAEQINPPADQRPAASLHSRIDIRV
ncbi:flagellar hook-length control protein FliK [Paracoccus luteus]|uniref:flagellar hook-length control protein FliK n=1 Tax=Paracoccus luteus TaxID=2508543 RepID=UPI0014311607|nr:flagellar hook-length control protein FliK [Paracoccus luteus]